ncbi:MAG: SBBP repeat-containing protein [Thermoanaerobaculaceae bacterium]|nr:SBBP repeat-containing protein [Thermoanaerobaculaceae bacterium]
MARATGQGKPLAAAIVVVLLAGTGFASEGRLEASFGTLPLAFEANQGQAESGVRYLARGPGFTIFLSGHGAQIALRAGESGSEILGMRLEGAAPSAPVAGEVLLPGVSHYFLGRSPETWRTSVRQFERVRYKGVYPGVDLLFYGAQGDLEYDFVVAPGADPSRIRLAYSGARGLRLDTNGDLVITMAGGELRHHAPVVYQESGGVRHAVDGRFRLAGPESVELELGRYDRTRPLVIDPVLSYSTLWGGSTWDSPTAVAVDASGAVYLTGSTQSVDLPLAGSPVQSTFGGSIDAFVAKVSPAGDTLVWATFLGGAGSDAASSLVLDASGAPIVAGRTASATFPVTPGAMQATLRGGYDVFVTKLSTAGTLVVSTYYGGAGDEFAGAMESGPGGTLFLTGSTRSSDLPLAGTPVQSTLRSTEDAFVAKINASVSSLVYSTYLGGSGSETARAIAVDGSGNAYVLGDTKSTDFPLAGTPFQGTYKGGRDAFVSRLNAAGSSLLYSTYLGGTLEEEATSIAVDSSGQAVVAGTTYSADYPTAAPYQASLKGTGDGYVSKLNAAGSGLVFSTYFGGTGTDGVNGLEVDGAGNVHVVGFTSSPDFPMVGGPLQGTYGGGDWDVFVARLGAAGSTLGWSTFLGGNLVDYASALTLDGSGAIYVVGETNSLNFPLAGAPFQTTVHGKTDAFIVKIGTGSSGGAPTAAFTWSPTAPAVGQVVGFTDTSTGTPTSWAWSFGDGATSAQRNPTHTYSAAGSKTVTLTATNQHGSSLRTQTVAVGCQAITAKPTLTATSVQSTSVTLSWTAVAGATSYELVLPLKGQTLYSGPNLTFTHAPTTPETPYTYEVHGVNVCGSGPSSDSLFLNTPAGASFVYWVPVASHQGGVGTSQWRTDLGMLNLGEQQASIELRFHSGGSVTTSTALVAAQSLAVHQDAVGQLGASGSGTLELRSNRELRVTSRTYNLQPGSAACFANGTLGQSYDAVPAGGGLKLNESGYLSQLVENASSRTNIALANTGTVAASVRVVLLDGSGATLTTYTVGLQPGEYKQERAFFTRGFTNLTRAYAKVTVTAGSGVVALASVVDTLTNDPTTIPLLR